MNSEKIWQTTTRILAVAGFVVVSLALLQGRTVPTGFYVILVGLFFGPDVYNRFGPGSNGSGGKT